MTALAKMAEVMDELGGRSWSAIQRSFERMKIAEEEITRASRLRSNSSPERRARIQRTFSVLCPPEQLALKSDDVYRSHARELVRRAAADEDCRPGTDAEVLCCMLDCSLAAPPTALVGLACARLFERVFGRSIGGELSAEPWPGAVAELVEDLRRKIAVPNRKLKDPDHA